MANITVSVTDANNITVQLTPVASQTITIDRGVAGNGISSIVPVTISTLQYLRIFYTNGTQQDVGPLTSTAYAGVSPIDITGNTISLLTVPINKGGTNATTAAAAIQNLLPSYTGNGSKRLGLNSGATALEWVADGGGTVTSVDVSGGTTGLTTSGGPITGSGTITLAGTLATSNGGTGLTSFTANGVVYASSTSALATGSALTFDGTKFQVSGSDIRIVQASNSANNGLYFRNFADSATFAKVAYDAATGNLQVGTTQAYDTIFLQNNAEAMRLTSTSLYTASTINVGIGTSSPGNKLTVKPSATSSGTLDVLTGSTNTDSVRISGGGTVNTWLEMRGYLGVKLYSDATNTVTVDSSGNLGIGGASTGSKLYITATNPTATFKATTTGYPYASFVNDGGDFYVGRDNSAGGAFGYAYSNVVWGTGAYSTVFATNNQLRMTLDSSGNLGLGVTPSAWNNIFKAVQINAQGALMATSASMQMGNNVYYDGAYKFIGTGYANRYYQATGQHVWTVSTASGSAGGAITETQAMTLDASGNLRIGTGSPGYKLDVLGNVNRFAGDNVDGIFLSTVAATDISYYGANYYNNNGTEGVNASGRASWRIATVTSGSPTFSIGYRAASAGAGVFSTPLTIDSSGNLGLGVTPSAWNAGGKIIELGFAGNILYGVSYSAAGATNNAYYSSGWKFANPSSARASLYEQSAGTHAWNISTAAGTAGNAISFTQAMTLDASGNLGVGTTSPSFRLHAVSSAAVVSRIGSSGGSGAFINFIDSGASPSVAPSVGAIGNSLVFMGDGSSSERARIDSSGNLLVGKTSSNNGTNGAQLSPTTQFFTNTNDYIALFNRKGTDGVSIYFQKDETNVGNISVTTSATAYNTSSDYRLKNTIAPMTGALAKVALLKPCTYKWNADGSDGQGFIAHELAEVVPQCVTGEKDAVDADGKPQYQGIDTSFLVATLTAAIQEQQALITQLTARITALEGA